MLKKKKKVFSKTKSLSVEFFTFRRQYLKTKMKFSLIILLALATLCSCSLLEMSQVLWSQILNGGYHRIGKLDPLRVPVVKVDQSEGDASYRVILRDLEIGGLNKSRLESVHIARGKLKSNLSDSEAGYVSYNEQRDLDSIRYRFHTLVKETKTKSNSGSEKFERIVQYDPVAIRTREEEEFLGIFGKGNSNNQQQQRQNYENFEEIENDQQQHQQQHVSSEYEESRNKQTKEHKGPQSSYGNMRVVDNVSE